MSKDKSILEKFTDTVKDIANSASEALKAEEASLAQREREQADREASFSAKQADLTRRERDMEARELDGCFSRLERVADLLPGGALQLLLLGEGRGPGHQPRVRALPHLRR